MAQKRNCKITCVMVMSINGKTTDGQNPQVHEWTSLEDQQYFSQTMDNAEAILMGSKTYDSAKTIMKHKSGRIRMVLTTRPQEYEKETIPGQLSFTADSPEKVVENLEKQGIQRICLVGGASLNAEFLEKGLIDELWVTVEPIVFPEGNSLFANLTKKQTFSLISMEKLNENGTLLLKYRL